MYRLGVAVRVLGRGGMPVCGRHLSIGILFLRDLLSYLAAQRIGCYRLADDLLPDLGQAGPTALNRQVSECAELLAEVGGLAWARGMRLTMPPGIHIALGATDDDRARRAADELCARAALLDALGAGPDGTLVLHIGGTRSEREIGLRRFAARYERLPQPVQQRIAVEPDGHGFDLIDLLGLHEQIGVPLVFDALHFQLNNPQQLALPVALGLALATWPGGVRPKIHISTQRTEAHVQPARASAPMQIIAPRHGQHADFLNPFEVVALLEAARGLPPFDIMLEAKAGDLALLRLRADLIRFAPRLAALVQ